SAGLGGARGGRRGRCRRLCRRAGRASARGDAEGSRGHPEDLGTQCRVHRWSSIAAGIASLVYVRLAAAIGCSREPISATKNCSVPKSGGARGFFLIPGRHLILPSATGSSGTHYPLLSSDLSSAEVGPS